MPSHNLLLASYNTATPDQQDAVLSGGEAFVAQETPYTERMPDSDSGTVSGALDE